MSALPLLSTLLLLLLTAPPGQDAAKDVEAAFAAQGLTLDLEHKTLAVPTRICIREDLLEYVLVADFGAAHESLLATDVSATLVNAALVTLGVQPGQNVEWVEKDPPPTPEEVRDGVPAWDVVPPRGDELVMYCAWKEDGEVYFFRLEDLITNLRTGRSMRRHGWVYLGSRLVKRVCAVPGDVVAMRDRFLSILGVNPKVLAVLAGDEHNYSRTRVDASVHPGFRIPIWQITSGGCGAPYYLQDRSVPWVGNVVRFSASSNYCLFDVDGPRVGLTVLGESGEVLDRVEDLAAVRK